MFLCDGLLVTCATVRLIVKIRNWLLEMGIFSSKNKHDNKKQKVNQHDKAVLDLKVQRDKLKQYQKKV